MISLFFLYSSWLWVVGNSIIVYNIGLWWSSLMMYQKVASCLHQSFLHAWKQRGEDTANFSQVFGGQEWTESALLFYEKFGDFCKKIKCRVPIFLMAMMWKSDLCFLVLLLFLFCWWHTFVKGWKIVLNNSQLYFYLSGYNKKLWNYNCLVGSSKKNDVHL